MRKKNNSYIYYPVVIPTLCRYELLNQLILSLKNNKYAELTELYIGVDYPRSENHFDGWKKIKQFVSTLDGFRNVYCFYHSENLGSSQNTAFLLKKVREKYDGYIFSEDDNYFSPCFLEFMDDCLNIYKNRDEIDSISGYLPPIFSNDLPGLIFSKTYFSAWGYGTWFNRDDELVKSIYVTDYRKKILNNKDNLKLLRTSLRISFHLFEWLRDIPSLNSTLCDITRETELLLTKKYCIHPQLSLVRNLGNDGSGEHCKTPNELFSNQIICDSHEYKVMFSNVVDSDWFEELLESSFCEDESSYEIQLLKKKLFLLKFLDINEIDMWINRQIRVKEKVKNSIIGRQLFRIKYYYRRNKK